MGTLVFDIETVGEDWETYDDTTKSVISRSIERTIQNGDARESALRDLREGLGFSPLTGRIVAIGIYDIERAKGVVFYDSEGTLTEEFVEGEYTFKPRKEAEMLRDFWEGAKAYDTFVTFNGRGFDAPFLALRSVANGITPTRNLLEGRYLYQQRGVRHIDLQDQLSFYGAVRRRESLHLYCRAFGIKSPKAEGVSGDDVALLFKEKKYLEIAKYNAEDVTATTILYSRWRTHLSTGAYDDNEMERY